MSLTAEQQSWIDQLNSGTGEAYLGAANCTAFHDRETGEVETNIEGLDRYFYASMEDFIEHEIKGNNAPHKHSVYIGERCMETGDITFNDNYDPQSMTIDESEDGSSVYSNFVVVKLS